MGLQQGLRGGKTGSEDQALKATIHRSQKSGREFPALNLMCPPPDIPRRSGHPAWASGNLIEDTVPPLLTWTKNTFNLVLRGRHLVHPYCLHVPHNHRTTPRADVYACAHEPRVVMGPGFATKPFFPPNLPYPHHPARQGHVRGWCFPLCVCVCMRAGEDGQER